MLEERLVHEIEGFVSRHQQTATTTGWQRPLVAFADAANPLFAGLKQAVRASHALPEDLLPGARSVLVYFLPFSREIPSSNRQGYHASRLWATGYVETNALIIALNQHLGALLAEAGHRSTIMPPTHNFDTEQLMSDWSHKHVAAIAGLGDFGVHHLLITAAGCCGRLGSIITDAPLSPSVPPEQPRCLHRFDGSCLACVQHCPTGALTEAAFDRHRCYAMLLENAEVHREAGYADVCGKCCCLVPCSFVDPVGKKVAQGG